MRRLLLFVACLVSATFASAAEFHVAPDGSDEQAGTAEAPVQSLEKARDLAREARKANPEETVSILLHPGIYMVRKTIEFTKDDSGTESAPLVIKAWRDPKNPADWPKLVGGVVVSDWKKSDFTNKALASSDLQVYEADLKPLGIERKFRQIYLDGARQIWARYPDFDAALPYSGGWAYVEGERPPMYKDIEGERTDTVVLREKDHRNWSRPTDGEVCIFPALQLVEPDREDQSNRRGHTHHYAGKEHAVRRPAGRSLCHLRHEGGTGRTGRMVPGR